MADTADRLSFFQDLLRLTVKRRGTDLYLAVGSPPKIRVGNTLLSLGDRSISPVIVEELIESVSHPEIFEAIDAKGEVNFATSFPGVARFRINIYKQRGSYCLVAHYITTRIPEFDDYDIHEGVREFADIEKGLLIVAGEGGSGRSTTVAAMINHRRRQFKSKIITLEDPIEYVFKHQESLVCQREFGTDFFDWESALRNCLRQSPDVVSIGEIDTHVKLQMALRIVSSGRLCIATLVATNISRAFGMLENLTPEVERVYLRQQLSRAIGGVSCQKMVTTAAGQSLAVFEIMSVSPFLVSLLADGEYQSIREYMSKEGEGHMQTIDDHIIQLFKQEVISREEAVQRAEVPEEIKIKLRSLDKGGAKSKSTNIETTLSIAKDGDVQGGEETFL